MAGLYSDILFHFTSSKGLKGILKEGFRVSYSRETIAGPTGSRSFAVPIVSFCDLRLSELSAHMKKYGKFGIGLTKRWAIEAGLNPVAYASQRSPFTSSVIDGIGGFFKQIEKISDWEAALQASHDYMTALNIQRYIKNYEGDLVRSGKNLGNYRFADEREWRYVLPMEKNILPFVAPQNIETPEHKKFLNAQISAFKLPFSAHDVKYIIVPRETNIKGVHQCIDSLPSTDSMPMKGFLKSRILTAQQIESDM